MENYQYAWFAQDNWKATPNLTVNFGLRYELSLPRTERHNRQNWFDPNAINPLNGGSITYQDPLPKRRDSHALRRRTLHRTRITGRTGTTDYREYPASLWLFLQVRRQDGDAGRLWYLLWP